MNIFWYWLDQRVRRSGARSPLRALLLLGACVTVCSGAQAQNAGFGPVYNLYSVMENMEGAPWSAVEMVAGQQANSTLGPVHRNIPTGTPFFRVFEGTFFPSSNLTRLAIFSDDGCNVYIDDQIVWSRFTVGQHLPTLKESLHPIPFEMMAGRPYKIRVQYSNTIYTGTTDADGATLFAYTYDENPNRPYAGWLVGQPISCAGIRWPSQGMYIRGGAVGTFMAFGATDWDELQRITQGVVTSRELSDSCTYSWTATGGSFVAGDGTFTGTSGSGPEVKWRAPTVGAPTSVTVTLVVDDRNAANMGVGETGTRNDRLGYNDPPLRFSVTVNIN